MAYAAKTTVSVDRSRAEIEQILHRYGCTAFGYGHNGRNAMIEFATKERRIRFVMTLPAKEKFRTRTVRGEERENTESQQHSAWEQACRSLWRSLCLAIKAKLEAVTAGISHFEDEFLAWVVDPATNRTVAELIKPQLALSYENHKEGKTVAPLALPAPDSE